MVIPIKFDSSNREGLKVLRHGLRLVLLLHDYLVLELAVSRRIESNEPIGVDADEAVVGIEEEDMLDLRVVGLGQHFVAVAHEVGNYGIPIVTAGGQDLAPLLH